MSNNSIDTFTLNNVINDILQFWFGINDIDKWFKYGSTYDSVIKQRFKTILELCIDTDQEKRWAETQRGFLAYIIVTDQFSRHIFRGTPRAYSQDKLALHMVKKYLSKYVQHLHGYELMFALMPFQHSEQLPYQMLGIQILSIIFQRPMPLQEREILQSMLRHHLGHLNVITMFTRFPKRNTILNRNTTIEEQLYIESSNELPY